MVGSVTCKGPIDLPSLANQYMDLTSYQPELFPGLHFKTKPGILLVFSSGKVKILKKF